MKTIPHRANNSSRPLSTRFLRPPKPKPRNANPDIGRNAAYQALDPCHNAVVTGRAVVVMVRVELAGLLLLRVTGVVEKVQAAPAGNPAEHVKATLLGKLGTGEICT
jgi:hypothetical protein